MLTILLNAFSVIVIYHLKAYVIGKNEKKEKFNSERIKNYLNNN
jgi:hypothetical protein